MNTDSDSNKLLGSRLKKARVAAHLSQDFTANTMGVTRQAVSKWETGNSCPTARQLGELATMYCVCAHSLLFGEPFRAVAVGDLMKGQFRPRQTQLERADGCERTTRAD
ncbi:helix-turn-helix transcriptional regulator [Comamonas testosteroni]|uniref:helix-turn-helix transcriptional regulator n=1 Tax=Comamonas testosteroni TaxID=285 RepID=UPI003D160B44